MKRNVSTAIGVLLAGFFALAQDTKPLTNYEIVQMLKAGFSDETIVTTIQTQPTAFDSSASALITLKSSGVSEAVIAAMLNSAKGASSNGSHNDNQPVLKRESPEKRTDGQLPAIYVEEVSSEGSQMASSDTTLEAIKTLQKQGLRVVTIKERADYVLQVTRQLGKKSWRKDTKVVLSTRDGDVVYTNSTRSVGGAMGDVVDYFRKNRM